MTREEAIKILKSKLDGSVDTSWEWAEAVRMAIEALADRPTGKWIKSNLLPHGWHCSLCDSPIMTDDIEEMLYCPNCGAKMEVNDG